MTSPNMEPRELPPFPLRVASILAAIVGAVTGLIAGSLLMTAAGQPAALINGTAGVVMAFGLCAASYLVWKRRRLGGWIVIATLLLPSIMVRVGSGVWVPPPLLLVLAALTLLATWPLLR
jgi:hypothetical protein